MESCCFLFVFIFLLYGQSYPCRSFSSHFFYNLDHLPESITVHYVTGNLLWCFGDSRDILGKSGTRAGGGQPKNLRQWRRFFSRLPGSIDKSIRNAAYYLWCLHLFFSICAKKTFLAFSAKISGVIKKSVPLMTIFTEEFTALSLYPAATDGTFILQSVCACL